MSKRKPKSLAHRLDAFLSDLHGNPPDPARARKQELLARAHRALRECTWDECPWLEQLVLSSSLADESDKWGRYAAKWIGLGWVATAEAVRPLREVLEDEDYRALIAHASRARDPKRRKREDLTGELFRQLVAGAQSPQILIRELSALLASDPDAGRHYHDYFAVVARRLEAVIGGVPPEGVSSTADRGGSLPSSGAVSGSLETTSTVALRHGMALGDAGECLVARPNLARFFKFRDELWLQQANSRAATPVWSARRCWPWFRVADLLVEFEHGSGRVDLREAKVTDWLLQRLHLPDEEPGWACKASIRPGSSGGN